MDFRGKRIELTTTQMSSMDGVSSFKNCEEKVTNVQTDHSGKFPGYGSR